MENRSYDYIIVGGGPCGLSLANCLSSTTRRILILEKDKEIGGAHKVKRVLVNGESLFSEHAPRVIINNYFVFQQLLQEMGVNFYDFYEHYNFTLMITINMMTKLKMYEILILGIEFLKLTMDLDYGINKKLKDFVMENHFTPETIEIIDRFCILTDGANLEKFTLNEMLQLMNQNFFYSAYQPKIPNDKGLFRIWREYLEKKQQVKILVNTPVKSLTISDRTSTIRSIITENGDEYFATNSIILALPPIYIKEILLNSSSKMIQNSFGNIDEFSKFAENTKYRDYISMTFHWNEKIDFEKEPPTFPFGPWRIISILSSKYTHFDESRTVISASVTVLNERNERHQKTANECKTRDELVDEVFHEISEHYGGISLKPKASILYPEVYHDGTSWRNEESGYISTSGKRVNFRSENVRGLYNCGVHNGHGSLRYTTLESAVDNAIVLAKELTKTTTTKFHPMIPYGITDVILFFLIIIIIIIVKIVY